MNSDSKNTHTSSGIVDFIASREALLPLIMGIVNVTPDSFSDGGRFLGHHAAVAHGLRLLDDGADILDIGGESTRPAGKDYGAGFAIVEEAEELRRVIPVIESIHRLRPDARISIDTMKPAVAREAVAAGAGMINDVSAGRFDPSIWNVAATAAIPYVLMHGHSPNAIGQVGEHHYDNVVHEVFEFLQERIDGARQAGVNEVIADVGIGFAKGLAENVQLLRHHRVFLELGVPLLIGASRKAFIGRLLGGVGVEERAHGTDAANAVAVINGASIIRVHDVAAARQFFSVFHGIMTA